MYRRKIIKLMILGASIPGMALVGLSTQTAKAEAVTSTKIPNMPVFAQQHHLSCEYAATRAALARWNIQLSEAAFIAAISVNENPHFGFRGNIDGNWGGIYNYGIYPEPIARFLSTRGISTKLLWNGVASIKEELSYGRPVVVWVIGSMGLSTPSISQAAGVAFILASGEHAMTLYGYDEGGVYAANPGYGTYDYYSWGAFTRSWAVLGNMAMSIWPSSQVISSLEGVGINPAFYGYWLNNSGMELIGQPLGLTLQSETKLIQYFERARLEWDGSQPPAGQISRGLLGCELTVKRQSEAPFKPLNPSEIENLDLVAKANFFFSTNFYIDRDFVNFWHSRGDLAVFGYPISRSFSENGLKVQYFERARLELHTGKSGQSSYILSGLLGQEILSDSRPSQSN